MSNPLLPQPTASGRAIPPPLPEVLEKRRERCLAVGFAALGIAVFSIGLGGPFPVAPWGNVEIDISGFVVLGFGLADATGTFAWPFAVPNTAAAIGTYGVQTLCGDAIRLFLSNAALLTITP